MAVKNKQHIKASTLMETLAAMVITIASFTAGFMIYEQVIRSRKSDQRALAKAMVSAILNSDNVESEQLDDLHPGLKIQNTTEIYDQNVDLKIVVIRDEKGKILYQTKKLIYQDEE